MISVPDLVDYIESNKNSKDGKRSIPSLKIVSNEKLTFADLLVRIGPLIGKVPKENLTLKSILTEGSWEWYRLWINYNILAFCIIIYFIVTIIYGLAGNLFSSSILFLKFETAYELLMRLSWHTFQVTISLNSDLTFYASLFFKISFFWKRPRNINAWSKHLH